MLATLRLYTTRAGTDSYKDPNDVSAGKGRDNGQSWTWASFHRGFAVGFIARGNTQP